MLTEFSTNNIFEELLTGGWDFDYQSRFIDPNYFIYENITETYEYELIINHINPINNVKQINDINYTLIPGMELNDIEFEYRYSVDGIDYSQWTSKEDLKNNISNIPNLWINVKIIISVETNINYELPFETIYIAGDRYLDSIFTATRINPGELKVFTAQDTYKVFKTTDYEVFLQSGNINELDIYFRYTQNQGRNWTEWLKLTDYNLQRQQYIRIKFVDFQFGFMNKGTQPIELYDLELIGDFQNVTGNYTQLGRYGLKTQCNPIANNGGSDCGCDEIETQTITCSPCSNSFTPWNQSLGESCNGSNVTNINDMNTMLPLVNLQQQMNEYIETRNGWEFDYYYTDADRKGIDTILNEIQLQNVIMKRKTKVIVPDNQFPADTITFSGFGMDLIVSFEVHIMRSSFKKIFGVESKPRKGDYMYLCSTNLLYEVEQVIDKKDTMNATFYWRVILKKYEEKASRKFAKTVDGDEAKVSTNSLVKYGTLDDLFSDANAVEMAENNLEINTHKDKTISHSQQATDAVDGTLTIYKEFSKKLNWSDESIWNASVKVSDTQYKLPLKSKNDKLVIYNYKDNNIDYIDNRAISMWFKTEEYSPTFDHTLLSNYDYQNNLGYKVNLFDGALILMINNDTYSVPVNIEENTWYVFYIGMNQSKSELELTVYKRQVEDGKTLSNNNLLKVASRTLPFNIFKFVHNEHIFIGGTDTFNINNNRNYYYLTNIAVWTEPIVKSKRNDVLSQHKFTDGHLIKLADEALKPLTLPFYGNI